MCLGQHPQGLLRLVYFLLLLNNSHCKTQSRKLNFNPDTSEMENLEEITARTYLDISIDGAEVGRIVLGLFGLAAPITVENFRALCTCETKKPSEMHQKPLCFRGTTFHRIIPGFIIQGGDITHFNGIGGESIYGGTFEDETFALPHSLPGYLSMSNKGPDTNGSQFFITLKAAPWLDGKHVVFGKVLEGMEVIDLIQATAVNEPTSWLSRYLGEWANQYYSPKKKKQVHILDCGELQIKRRRTSSESHDSLSQI